MPIQLPYYPFIAHWVPGFVTLSFLMYPFFIKYIGCNPSEGMAMIIIFFFTAISFAIGQIIDAFTYSITEPYLNKCCPLDWDKFAEIEKEDERMKNIYFSNYVFDINLSVGLIFGSLYLILNFFDLFFPCCWKLILMIIVFIISLLLVCDAICLRKKMDIVSKKKQTNHQPL